MAISRTLPDHERCDTHRGYKLSCEQYERLLARSGQRCEICRNSVINSQQRKLFIDHAGPRWAVRGLLCTGCNTRLRDGTGWFPGSAEYLSRTWWVAECVRAGVPTTLAPEPHIGNAIRDQYGVVWIREGDGAWHPYADRRGGLRWTWQQIFDRRGPQNMPPFDVYSADGTEVMQVAAEQAFDDLGALIDREVLLDEGRADLAHDLLVHFSKFDHAYYRAQALRAAGNYEPTEAEIERSQIDRAVRGVLDERDRLYDIVMGLLHALPDGKERWTAATERLGATAAQHKPVEVIEETLFAALTEGAIPGMAP